MHADDAGNLIEDLGDGNQTADGGVEGCTHWGSGRAFPELLPVFEEPVAGFGHRQLIEGAGSDEVVEEPVRFRVEETAWGVSFLVAVGFKEEVAGFVVAIALDFHFQTGPFEMPEQIDITFLVFRVIFDVFDSQGFGNLIQPGFDIPSGAFGDGHAVVHAVHGWFGYSS